LKIHSTNRAVTKTEAAYEALRAAIESGELEPGAPLRLANLQESLGMSPTPIREALRLLQADGLVSHKPHYGMIVAEYSAEDVEEVYRLRMVLEPLATALCAERATDAELQAIHEINDRYRDTIGRRGKQHDAVSLNVAWHHAIYSASRSRYLEEFIARLGALVPNKAFWRADHAEWSASDHDTVTRALLARDPASAAELMRRHIKNGKPVQEPYAKSPNGVERLS
jgi:DNA-binding GntR family transcriptional regulator